ncbi:23S rRNA (guanine(745)-N(1))-methyltransferase [Motilimonas pumila]|uniref:23S rRNA (Guanine(745)-N(1))-methyltransferase n=1 Tax=Motilimonas pumila TaxID=2303987 RepID=A0A418YIR5_9GAMM|nr:23S rRNA (guanine(745)-N(1))-methyltransferase [Motilimonas pumila]RJG50543.1 23S rRNA (guanine(745)-N(1))-methyltransferase [Motilimonas pumila]
MTMYLCPLCQSPLQREAKMARCQHNHCFDYAKEGYLNLLPVNKKKSADPGDNKQMMQARRDFLNAGHYQVLAEQLSDICRRTLPQASQLLDIGCGEGYYTQYLSQAFPEGSQSYGLDISKSAIKFAARRAKQTQFCVASAYDLPFAANSFDLVCRIYAPSQASELARVIKPQGYLLTVSPGAEHLFQLKQQIYQQAEMHDESAASIDGFTLQHQQQLKHRLHLTQSQDISNLLEMTPFAWKLSPEQKAGIAQQPLTLDIAFNIELHQKS